MPDGGKLTIETANSYLDEGYARMNDDVQPGQYVGVFVTDSGTGMSPEICVRHSSHFSPPRISAKGQGWGCLKSTASSNNRVGT